MGNRIVEHRPIITFVRYMADRELQIHSECEDCDCADPCAMVEAYEDCDCDCH